MTLDDLMLGIGVFMASFVIGYVNAALGDPLHLRKIGLLPRR